MVGIEGSFGILRYALLALSPSCTPVGGKCADKAQHQDCSLTDDLLGRGFRRACNNYYADIALKAQQADGTVLCRASTGGFVSLWFDGDLVWSQRFDPEEEASSAWLTAAKDRDVTLISGDHVLVSGTDVDLSAAAAQGTLVMGRIPTVWA